MSGPRRSTDSLSHGALDAPREPFTVHQHQIAKPTCSSISGHITFPNNLHAQCAAPAAAQSPAALQPGQPACPSLAITPRASSFFSQQAIHPASNCAPVGGRLSTAIAASPKASTALSHLSPVTALGSFSPPCTPCQLGKEARDSPQARSLPTCGIRDHQCARPLSFLALVQAPAKQQAGSSGHLGLCSPSLAHYCGSEPTMCVDNCAWEDARGAALEWDANNQRLRQMQNNGAADSRGCPALAWATPLAKQGTHGCTSSANIDNGSSGQLLASCTKPNNEGGQRTSWPRHRLLSSSSFSHAMPPDHPVLVSMAKRKSVFYRRPKPPSPQPPADQTPEDAAEQESSDIGSDGDCSCASPAAHDTGYEPGSDASDESEEEMYTTAAYLDTDTEFLPSYDSQLSYQLCQQLPFFSCHFAQDTQSFIPTQSPAHLVRPCTVKEQPTVYEMDEREFYPPTLEIVDSIIEYLNLIYRVDTCAAIIPMGRRLPELHEFIWRLMDGTMVDLWTAIACAILLRRIYRSRSYSEEAPYEAAHSLFLGVFMLSSISCVNTSRPEVLGAAGIVRILDSWYETHDLVRIKRETLVLLNYRTWISLPDILAYGKNNIFDIYRINSSYTFFKKRQEQRMRLEEENQKRIARRKSLVARLERFMHRTPHDSLGSWNTETMYCTESRFLFRHLPWFPGSINPVHVTARSENINLYYNSWNKKYLPVFSPLLPPTRTRVSSTTN